MKKTSNLKQGQALTEYLILVAILGVGSIAVVQILGKNLKTRLANVSDAIQGKSSHQRNGTDLTDKQLKKNDLGDFSDAIEDTNQQN